MDRKPGMKYYDGEETAFAKKLMFEGSTAAVTHAGTQANPYPEGSVEHKWWKVGYIRTFVTTWVDGNIGPEGQPPRVQ